MEQLNELSKINIEEILLKDDQHFKLEDTKYIIARMIEGADSIVGHNEYWEELPKQSKEIISNEVATLLRYINAIQAHKGDPQWLSSNLQGHKDAILTLYGTLYTYLVGGIREYINSLDEQKNETVQLLKELKSVSKQARSAERSFKEASSGISTVELSRFFDEVANGDTTGITKYKRTWKYRVDSYSKDARWWFVGVLFMIVFTTMLGTYIFWDIRNSSALTLEGVFARALILAGPAYGVKFCSRNYSLAKNLKITNTHRAVIMKTLLAFIQRDDISPDIKGEILREAASQAFKPDAVITNNENDAVIEVPIPFKR